MYDSVFESCRQSVKLMQNGDLQAGFVQASELAKKYPDNASAWYCMGVYFKKNEEFFKAIGCFTKSLENDPGFIEAAEALISLNGDNYSVSEIKYLYTVILKYKPGNLSMHQFLEKFKDIIPASRLSGPDIGQDELRVDSLPGSDNKKYIEKLLNEMDTHNEETISEQRKAAGAEPVSVPKINIPRVKTESRETNGKSKPVYKVETLTMARLYVRQGLFQQSLEILQKLRERNPKSRIYINEINRVRKLIEESEKEKR